MPFYGLYYRKMVPRVKTKKWEQNTEKTFFVISHTHKHTHTHTHSEHTHTHTHTHTHRKIPDAKIMLSLPLRTRKDGHTYMKANEDILRLRTAMNELVNNGCSANQPLKERRLLMNVNTNLGIVGGISLDNCCSDGIHLSSRGRSKILSNCRHHIHEITRQILNNHQGLTH